MSPEQVLADPLELGTRSDVYSLGVILFELLAKRLPYEVNNRPDQAVQAIREKDPIKVSSINHAFRGDVETIVDKALEKDKTRRYSSAAALALDLRHYLANEPITARPATPGYQLQKFARRQKTLVAAAATVIVVLLAGVVASTWEAIRARRAEEAAVTAEQAANAVSDFLRNDLLTYASSANQAGTDAKPDPDLKVRTALDRAAAKIAGKFDRQPEVEAAIRNTIGETYNSLGLNAEARKQLEHALELYRRTVGPENPKTLTVASRLANLLEFQGDNQEAAELLSQTLEIERHILGREHPDTLRSMNILANIYGDQGKYALTEALQQQILESKRRVLGPTHLSTLVSMANLALSYEYQAKYEQAEALLRQTLEISRRVLGPEHVYSLGFLSDLASVYQRQGKYSLAENYAAQVLAGSRRTLGSDHALTATAAIDLAMAYQSEGKFVPSGALAREALEFNLNKQPDDWQRFLAESLLGASLAGQKEYAEAETPLLEGYHGMAARKEKMHVPNWYYLDRAREWIIQLYEAWGKPSKAAQWSRRR